MSVIVAFPVTPKLYITSNDLEWPFYVNFSLLRTAVAHLRYILIVEPIYRIFLYDVTSKKVRTPEADRDPQNIAYPRKDCGPFVDEKLRALHRRSLNK